MTVTVYTIHAAYNHRVAMTFKVGDDMAQMCRDLARDACDHKQTVRFYVDNGVGVIAAFLCRNGEAHPVLRDDYLKFHGAAVAARSEHGIPAC